MFQNVANEFQRVFRTLRGFGKLSEKNMEDAVRQVRMSLLAADVNVNVVKEFISGVREKAMGSPVLDSLTPAQQFIKIINEELIGLMGEDAEPRFACNPPAVVMCVGLQGSGKTTTVAKLARFYKERHKRCYLVPADLRRPAAVEQLTVLGGQLGIDVHPSRGGISARDVACDAVSYAARYGYDLVLVDTAGRLHVDTCMMDEVKSVAAGVNPHHILFVADALTGQDAVKSAKAFSEALPLTGVILTKLDGDARGGAALSIRKVTGSPVFFVGTGEKLDALERFIPERMASRILGMGDVLTLIETAAKSIDEKEAVRLTERVVSGSFTLDDLKEQFRAAKKIGPLGKMLGMLPMSSAVREKLSAADMEAELKRKEAIINSMTPLERRSPRMLNGSRRMRIASGSGTKVSDVNKLIREFEAMQKMMKNMRRGGMKSIMNLMNLMR